MHSIENNGNVPAFLTKLWRLVNDPSTNEMISWSRHGRSFILKNQGRFASELLPRYYKHNNLASFVRQLNMYGFHKVVSVDSGGMRLDKDDVEFAHAHFIRGHEDSLEHIKRKSQKRVVTLGLDDFSQIPSSKFSSLSGEDSKVPFKLLNDIQEMKNAQERLTGQFVTLKQQNDLIWREYASLRQKFSQQQNVIEKLVHFLVAMVKSPNKPMNHKRKFQHLCLESMDGLSDQSFLTPKIELVDSPQATTFSRGAVIEDVTDLTELPEYSTHPIIANTIPTIKNPSKNITPVSPVSVSTTSKGKVFKGDPESSKPITENTTIQKTFIKMPNGKLYPVTYLDPKEEVKVLSDAKEVLIDTSTLPTIPENNRVTGENLENIDMVMSIPTSYDQDRFSPDLTSVNPNHINPSILSTPVADNFTTNLMFNTPQPSVHKPSQGKVITPVSQTTIKNVANKISSPKNRIVTKTQYLPKHNQSNNLPKNTSKYIITSGKKNSPVIVPESSVSNRGKVTSVGTKSIPINTKVVSGKGVFQSTLPSLQSPSTSKARIIPVTSAMVPDSNLMMTPLQTENTSTTNNLSVSLPDSSFSKKDIQTNLEDLQSSIDSIQDLLSSPNFNLDASAIMSMISPTDEFMPDLDSFNNDGGITGNEVSVYTPSLTDLTKDMETVKNPDSFFSDFDTGMEPSTSGFAGLLNDLETTPKKKLKLSIKNERETADDEDLNTPMVSIYSSPHLDYD